MTGGVLPVGASGGNRGRQIIGNLIITSGMMYTQSNILSQDVTAFRIEQVHIVHEPQSPDGTEILVVLLKPAGMEIGAYD